MNAPARKAPTTAVRLDYLTMAEYAQMVSDSIGRDAERVAADAAAADQTALMQSTVAFLRRASRQNAALATALAAEDEPT